MNGGRRRECHFPSTVVSRAIPVFRSTEFALTEPLPNRSGLGFLIPPPASAILPAATRPHHPFLPSAGITPSTSPFSSHLSVTPGNRRRCNTSSLTTIQQPFQSRPWADGDTMSNSHQLRPYISVGEIDHVHILSEHLGGLIQGEEYSDVTFLVEKRRFPAHRVILAARCQYFRALLYGGMRESHSQAEIPLPDTPADAFTMLLKYIYTGQVTLSNVKEEVLLDFLSLAHKYGFPELEAAASEYLCTILSISNVCMVYDVANLYSLTKLENTCCLYIDRNAKAVLGSEGFLTLSKNALLKVVSRDSFAAPEKEIFLALMNWCKQNPGEMYADIMKMVRLPLMSLTELLNVVRPSSLLSADTILDAIKVRSESRDMELNYRGVLIPDENIASMKHGAQVIGGELKAALLDGDSQNYDLDHGFSRHPIDEDCRSAIEVKLGQASIVNHIRMLLWDRDSRSYSYYVEVSMDELDWIRIIDHSKYLCRSWQNLFFTPRVCRYIRIVGTHNTVNKVFHLVSFECMYSSKHFLLDAGMLENVATVGASAAVIEGVSRSRNALLNGDTKNYDWDSGYTCHQLGSGAIVIQLAQPFVISSMRLLLWDCDDRSYSFYVEVSNDQQQWRMVADHTKITCKSWQTIIIEQQPVVFIRIVGTHNTANEVFHCVHFECPAQNQVQQQCEAWLGGRAEAGSRASPGLLSQGTLSGARPESRR